MDPIRTAPGNQDSHPPILDYRGPLALATNNLPCGELSTNRKRLVLCDTENGTWSSTSVVYILNHETSDPELPNSRIDGLCSLSLGWKIRSMSQENDMPKPSPFSTSPDDVPTAPLLTIRLSRLLANGMEKPYTIFDLIERFYSLSLEEKIKEDSAAEGSYFGYKGMEAEAIDGKGTLDNNEIYKASTTTSHIADVSKDDILSLTPSIPAPPIIATNRNPLIYYIHANNAILTTLFSSLPTSPNLPFSPPPHRIFRVPYSLHPCISPTSIPPTNLQSSFQTPRLGPTSAPCPAARSSLLGICDGEVPGGELEEISGYEVVVGEETSREEDPVFQGCGELAERSGDRGSDAYLTIEPTALIIIANGTRYSTITISYSSS
ncbi:uncharacterized protein BDR25DRAFT_350318 [Lindgomyces ingoldianus]|uniref:Uncharacterized protein n=1 Tax=Lindgomyces ingoldianus TaxID=673940 RepID=A0ACB6R9X2_9PLEO|nr:uncharacterized protein BDR25DRAFT_350318 [Lindgomyces ingoldianus]KAF2476049.1 hypothetical protein BDR25DRAFT_350318 [Lindgomyces ingoldianus]